MVSFSFFIIKRQFLLLNVNFLEILHSIARLNVSSGKFSDEVKAKMVKKCPRWSAKFYLNFIVLFQYETLFQTETKSCEHYMRRICTTTKYDWVFPRKNEFLCFGQNSKFLQIDSFISAYIYHEKINKMKFHNHTEILQF